MTQNDMNLSSNELPKDKEDDDSGSIQPFGEEVILKNENLKEHN